MVPLTFEPRSRFSRVHLNVCDLGEKCAAKQMKVAVPLSSSFWVGVVRSRDVGGCSITSAKNTHRSICSSNGHSRFCSWGIDCVATVYQVYKKCIFFRPNNIWMDISAVKFLHILYVETWNIEISGFSVKEAVDIFFLLTSRGIKHCQSPNCWVFSYHSTPHVFFLAKQMTWMDSSRVQEKTLNCTEHWISGTEAENPFN